MSVCEDVNPTISTNTTAADCWCTGSSPAALLDHQESHLKAALSFIGLTDIVVIRAEGLGLSDESKAIAVAKARAEIEALAA